MIPIIFQARVVAETNKQRTQQLHGSGLRRHSAEGRHCEPLQGQAWLGKVRRGQAMCGEARQCLAEQGEVRQRSVWRGVAWQGKEVVEILTVRHGEVRLGVALRGLAGRGTAWLGMARKGGMILTVRLGEAWRSMARRSMVWRSEVRLGTVRHGMTR